MILPILIDYDTDKPIGCVSVQDGKLVAEFQPGTKITRGELLNIFGNIGFSVMSSEIKDGVEYILKVRIFVFSRSTMFEPKNKEEKNETK